MRGKILLCLLLIMAMVGTASADTLLYYINSTWGGYASEETDSDFYTMRNAAGDDFNSQLGTSTVGLRLQATTNSNEYSSNRRSVLSVNLSPIPDDATLTGAVIGFYGISHTTNLGNPGLNIVGITGAGTVAATQYNNWYSDKTRYVNSDLSISSWNDGGWNNFTLNSYGLSNISVDGTVNGFMLVNSWDIDNTTTGLTWSSAETTGVQYRDRTTAITTNTVLIEVTYTLPDTTPPSSITNLVNNTTTCQQINWTWTNPINADFNHTYILKDNVFYGNVSNTTTHSLWTGLVGGQAYTFSSKTVDLTGNMNTSWVNMTATAGICATPTPTPTPTQTPLRCLYFNLTNTTFGLNSSDWNTTEGLTQWGVSTTNQTQGNVSWWMCKLTPVPTTAAPWAPEIMPSTDNEIASPSWVEYVISLWWVWLLLVVGYILVKK
jgi:hypothetical protein